MYKNIHTIVIGGLHTDIIASGVDKILASGEYTHGKELQIGPGGKSRNIAQMIAALSKKQTVAMIGKTSQDPFQLWKPPIQALQKAGVNIDFVQQLPFEKIKQFPAIALIPVDKKGNNQIYVLSGINNYFLPEDVDRAEVLFETAHKNSGVLILTLEQPLATAIHAVKKAKQYSLKVLFDLGGIEENLDNKELLQQEMFLIKPNEHEAKILTGVTVTGFETAKKAAYKLLNNGISNVFITHGKKGGYLFNKNLGKHIMIPTIKIGSIKDETGCGDQTMAAIAFALQEGKDIVQAAKIGILAGTLQFYKSGIKPVTKKELENHKNSIVAL